MVKAKIGRLQLRLRYIIMFNKKCFPVFLFVLFLEKFLFIFISMMPHWHNTHYNQNRTLTEQITNKCR